MPVDTQGKNGSAILMKILDPKCNKELKKVWEPRRCWCVAIGADDGR